MSTFLSNSRIRELLQLADSTVPPFALKREGATTVIRDGRGICLGDLRTPPEADSPACDRYLVTLLNSAPDLLAEVLAIRESADAVLPCEQCNRTRRRRNLQAVDVDEDTVVFLCAPCAKAAS